MENKKITYFLIILFSFAVCCLLVFYFVNKVNISKVNNQRVDQNQPSDSSIEIKPIIAEDDVLKNNLLSVCDTKECFLEKFKKCEQIQYKYNNEKSLYLAVLDKNLEKDTCLTVTDLSTSAVLSCEIKPVDLTEKNFNEMLVASLKNISYLRSIGCSVLE